MISNFPLLMHNIGTVVSLIVAFSFGVFALFNNPRKTTNITLALVNFCVTIFYIFHLLGTNTPDSHLSKLYLMWNLIIILCVALSAHLTFLVTNLAHKKRGILISLYVLALGMIIFFILFPDSFLLDSVPKMYFPNYYVPGNLNWLMRVVFNIMIPIYLLFELIVAYTHTVDPIEKNRLKYFLFSVVIGYGVGIIPIFLIFNIPVDPLWGIWFAPLYIIPQVYAVVMYELVDIKIIARKAFLYSLYVVTVGGVIILLNFSNQWISSIYPSFPFWIIPLISSLAVVFVGIFIWSRLKESDVLKSEFITTVTNKFRSPLNYIKLSAEDLLKGGLPDEQLKEVENIKLANAKMMELINLLVDVSGMDNKETNYNLKYGDVSLVVKESISFLSLFLKSKNMRFEEHIESGLHSFFVHSRISFVLHVLIENAIHYGSPNGVIIVSAARSGKNGKDIEISVTDNGIGIARDKIPLVFSKFYRTYEARLRDAEGTGIGLYVSKEIIKRHHGTIYASSSGLGKGSTFTFKIPFAFQANSITPTKQ